MICLRCGYCCINHWCVIVDDPEKGPVEGNLIVRFTVDDPCKHLRGDTPGSYICAVHDRPWYPDMPCYQHGQSEKSPDEECRIGRYILDKLNATEPES